MKHYFTVIIITFLSAQVNAQEFTIRNFPGIYAQDIFVDEEHNLLWTAELYNGNRVGKFDGTNWEYLTSPNGLPIDSVYGIERDSQGNMLFASRFGVAVKKTSGESTTLFDLSNYDGGVLKRFGQEMWLSYNYHGFYRMTESDTVIYGTDTNPSYFSFIEKDGNGKYWVATYNSLYSFDGSSSWSLDSVFNDIDAFHVDSNNTLWVAEKRWSPEQGEYGQLYSRASGHAVFEIVETPILNGADIHSIASDKYGVLYLATSKGLVIKNGNRWSLIDSGSGLISNYLLEVEVNNQTNVVFVSGYEGISMLINEDPLGNASAVRGIVYDDVNNNGEKDTDEVGVAGQFIKVDPKETFVITGSDGEFSFQPLLGENSITWIANDFFEAGITPVSFDFMYAADDTLYLEIGLNFKEVTEVSVNLAGVAVRPGFDATFYLSYKNEGSVDVDTKLSFTHDPILIFTGSSIVPDNHTTNKLEWNITNLKSMEKGLISVKFTTPVNTPLGIELNNFVSIDSLLDEIDFSNNADTLVQIVTGSFDPNDKLVAEGVQEARYSKIDQGLTYTIRFQNTGTDTAFFVRVIDTLDINFDVTSFELLATSHEVDYSLNDRIMSFTFHDILLPDSTRDEPKSHGFIKYRIRNKEGILDNTVVKNSAAIYFDFNLPVLTNEVSNVYVNELPEVITKNEPEVGKYCRVYPNPANGFIILETNGNEVLRGQIVSAMGILLKDFEVTGSNEKISMDAFPTGLYFIRIQGTNGYEVQKVIIR